MNHTELLNHLAAKHNLKYYLEIGVQNPANNLNKINCPVKVGVDPEVTANNVFKMPSNDYFKLIESSGQELTKEIRRGHSMISKFDLIFIDGLHHADQVKRDFENSLRCLNDGGFIVIHDCLPEDEITTCVPRGDQKMWHGDVYKFIMQLYTYNDINFITYNFDNGCCVVWKGNRQAGPPFITVHISEWDFYKQNRKEYMNISEWQKELV